MELLNTMELLKYCRFIQIFMNFIEISKEWLKKRDLWKNDFSYWEESFTQKHACNSKYLCTWNGSNNITESSFRRFKSTYNTE